MRLSRILNLLSATTVLIPHGRGSYKVGGRVVPGKYAYHYVLQEAMAQFSLREERIMHHIIQERLAAKLAEEKLRFEEARRRQALLKTSLFATLLSEL